MALNALDRNNSPGVGFAKGYLDSNDARAQAAYKNAVQKAMEQREQAFGRSKIAGRKADMTEDELNELLRQEAEKQPDEELGDWMDKATMAAIASARNTLNDANTVFADGKTIKWSKQNIDKLRDWNAAVKQGVQSIHQSANELRQWDQILNMQLESATSDEQRKRIGTAIATNKKRIAWLQNMYGRLEQQVTTLRGRLGVHGQSMQEQGIGELQYLHLPWGVRVPWPLQQGAFPPPAASPQGPPRQSTQTSGRGTEHGRPPNSGF
jgi:chromosome segregation ATPase